MRFNEYFCNDDGSTAFGHAGSVSDNIDASLDGAFICDEMYLLFFDASVQFIGNYEYVLNDRFMLFVNVKYVAGECVGDAHAFIIDEYIVTAVLCVCKDDGSMD